MNPNTCERTHNALQTPFKVKLLKSTDGSHSAQRSSGRTRFLFSGKNLMWRPAWSEGGLGLQEPHTELVCCKVTQRESRSCALTYRSGHQRWNSTALRRGDDGGDEDEDASHRVMEELLKQQRNNKHFSASVSTSCPPQRSSEPSSELRFSEGFKVGSASETRMQTFTLPELQVPFSSHEFS